MRAVPRGEEVATLAIDGYGESAHSDLVVLPAGVPFQALEIVCVWRVRHFGSATKGQEERRAWRRAAAMRLMQDSADCRALSKVASVHGGATLATCASVRSCVQYAQGWVIARVQEGTGYRAPPQAKGAGESRTIRH